MKILQKTNLILSLFSHFRKPRKYMPSINDPSRDEFADVNTDVELIDPDLLPSLTFQEFGELSNAQNDTDENIEVVEQSARDTLSHDEYINYMESRT